MYYAISETIIRHFLVKVIYQFQKKKAEKLNGVSSSLSSRGDSPSSEEKGSMQLLTFEKGNRIEDRNNRQSNSCDHIQNRASNANIHGNRETAIEKRTEQVALEKGDKVATCVNFVVG
jgi:hypothetical protein